MSGCELPPEVLEIVFSCLPLSTLLGSCTLVCSTWRDIIAHHKFIRWRKLYYKIKAGQCLEHPQEDEDDDLYHEVSQLNLSSTSATSWPIVESQKLFSKITDPNRPGLVAGAKDILFLLSYSLEKYQKRQHLFSDIIRSRRYAEGLGQLGQVTEPQSAPGPVMVTPWLILTSSSVWDLRSILRCLVSSSSSATTADISEYLYMLATLLLLINQKWQKITLYHANNKIIFSRLHYLVFHALYFIENEWLVTPTNQSSISRQNSAKKSSGQQSLMSFGFAKSIPSKIPTAEQLRIIHHPLGSNQSDLIKIVAFAGTGKTTTLVKLTENNPNLKFLLVVYNKSVRIQAESQFPKANVSCKTVHQMAMAKCGFMFSKKLTSNLRAKDILDSDLLVQGGEGEGGLYRRAGQVLATLTSFMNSADPEISLEHVPSVWSVGNTVESLSSLQRQIVLGDSLTVWRVMTDKEDNRLRIPHDGYLKVWQLRKPNLQWVKEHDVLLLDEGQDMNPTMLDIFMRQTVSRVIVGDPHQQIYMFRGAVNALDLVNPTQTYFLTQSFRFGPEIAFVANQCLEQLKEAGKRTLVGGKKSDSYLGGQSKTKDQVAYIGRTNFGLFEKLNKLLAGESAGKRVGLVGGAESYNFDDYLDVYYLMRGRTEKMKKYKNWKSYAQFKAFAKNVNDIELLSKIKIVETFGERMPGMIAKIKSSCAKDITKADIVLSTIHKSKGLEFDTVCLLDDFTDLREMFGPGQGRLWPEDEKNLLYVAITRAKTNLVMNSLLKEELLSMSLYSLTSYRLGEALTCGNEKCGQDLSDSLVPGQVMVTRAAHSMSGHAHLYTPGAGLGSLGEGGASAAQHQHPKQYFCSKCSCSLMPAFKPFMKVSEDKRGVKRKIHD